jgi:m7GpppX diphosphatase
MYVKPKIKCPEWIIKIEEGNANGEVILHENDDYYLLPDFKWDHKIKNLYLLVIFKDPELQSIRDLTDIHIFLLERTQRQVLKFVADNYGLPPSKMRCFFHYMPSAWRLHMHVQHVSSNLAPCSGTQCGRARLLGEILSNIKLMPDYYQRANLECVINRDRYNEFYTATLPSIRE